MFWSMHTGILAAIAIVFARYAAYFVPLSDTGLRVVAVGAILVLSAINYVGVRFGGRVQTAFTIVKVLAIAGDRRARLVAGGAMPRARDRSATVTVANFLLAVGAGLFAFGGWHMVTYTAEETIDPDAHDSAVADDRHAIVTVCYIGLNAVYLRVLPIEKVHDVDARRGRHVRSAGRAGGAGVISALVMFSAFGALNGIVLVGPRVYYQMAQDGLLRGWFNHLHPTPSTRPIAPSSCRRSGRRCWWRPAAIAPCSRA